MTNWISSGKYRSALISLLIAIFGLLTLKDSTTEVFPYVDTSKISVEVKYPGASPQNIEKNLIIPIERELDAIDEITSKSSTAYSDYGKIVLDLVDGASDKQAILNKIRGILDGLTNIPADRDSLTVKLVENPRNVINIAVYGETNLEGLEYWGAEVKRLLKDNPNIDLIKVYGAQTKDLVVEIGPDAIQAYKLAIDNISNAIKSSSVTEPAGSLIQANGNLSIYVNSSVDSIEKLQKIRVDPYNRGSEVTLGDVATVSLNYLDKPTIYRFNGKPAVGLEVSIKENQDMLVTSKSVKKELEVIQDILPSNIRVKSWKDESIPFQNRVELLLKNGLWGGLLIFFVISLVLDLRLAMLVCISLICVIFGASIILYFIGVTINQMSLFGFLLALGLIVDDTIIVSDRMAGLHSTSCKGENFRFDPIIKPLIGPIVLSAMTSMVVFLPILYFSGMDTKLAKDIPLVVVILLCVSLFECLVLLPCHYQSAMKIGNPEFMQKIQKVINSYIRYLFSRIYRPILHAVYQFKVQFLIISFAAVWISISILSNGIIDTQFRVDVTSRILELNIPLKEGTTNTVSEGIYDRVQHAFEETKSSLEKGSPVFIEDMESWGSSNGLFFRVELNSGSVLLAPIEEFKKQWIKNIGFIPEAVGVYYIGRFHSNARSDISLSLTGDDLESLSKSVSLTKEFLQSIPGVSSVYDSFSQGKREISLAVKPLAAMHGLTLQDIVQQVNTLFGGLIVEEIIDSQSNTKRDIVIIIPREIRNLSTLEQLSIVTNTGDSIPLSSVVQISSTSGFSAIKRLNGQRVVNVSASMNKETISLKSVNDLISTRLKPDLERLMPDVFLSIKGEREQKNVFKKEAVKYYGLALLFICLVLLFTTDSITDTIAIVSILPFCLLGMLVGHWLFSVPITALSALGLFAAAGVSLNDNLLLISHYRRMIDKGENVLNAIESACSDRFRPILLTSITTFIGLMPIMLEHSFQAQFLKPMVISLAFGVLISTSIILLFTPVTLLIMNERSVRL